jgi:glycerophosphoryl diester phosphodiesterase
VGANALVRSHGRGLVHDESTARTCNGGGRVQELTLAEVKALDAGYWWGTGQRYSRGGEQRPAVPWATYPYRGLGLAIPTLSEVLTAFPNVTKLVELKTEEGADPAVPEAVVAGACAAIRAANGSATGVAPASERVVVASFDSSALERFRQACPEVATAHGLTEVVQLFLASLFGAQAVVSPPGANLAVPHYFSLGGMRIEVPTSGFVGAARTRGLDVQTYDVEDPVTMVDLYARGVQAMLTDRVDLALAVRLTEWPRTCGLDPPVPVPRAVPAYRACASLGRCSAGSRARPPTSA